MSGFRDRMAMDVIASPAKTAGESQTRRLLNTLSARGEKDAVWTRHLDGLDHEVRPGTFPDGPVHAGDRGDRPGLRAQGQAADIPVGGAPLSPGVASAVCRVPIVRPCAMWGRRSDRGQPVFRRTVGGTFGTRNADGITHASMPVGQAPDHLGVTIPRRADRGRIGEAESVPSHGDDDGEGWRAGFDDHDAQRTAAITRRTLLHPALMPTRADGLPIEGKDRTTWKTGAQVGFVNPDNRS